MSLTLQLSLALALDLVLGDPRWRFHPVRLIGLLCSAVERIARQSAPFIGLTGAGALSFLAITTMTAVGCWLLLHLLHRLHPVAGDAAAVIMLYFCIAAGDLLRHSREVHRLLVEADLTRARQAVAMLVGRDTAAMQPPDIARACIESVAENLVDGITAPLFWAIVAGLAAHVLAADPVLAAALGAIVYKAINTMDSMFGYKNERYLKFGRWAARADDGANFLPARLSGLVVLAASALMGHNYRRAARVFFSDRLKSTSPNSGHTEAAVAGALGIELGGTSSYFGIVTTKPLIGQGQRKAAAGAILSCNRLVLVSALLFAGAGLLLYHGILLIR